MRAVRIGLALVAVFIATALGTVPGRAAIRLADGGTATLQMGVNDHPLNPALAQSGVAPVDADKQAQLAATVGASWVRIDVHWAWMEPTGPGLQSTSDQVKRLDAFLRAASKRHLRVLATVTDSPCWASSDPFKHCSTGSFSQIYPPSSAQAYAAFILRLIAHAGKLINAYEVWNEPNSSIFWGGTVDASKYVSLVRATYNAVHPRYPWASIVAGSTSYADTSFVAGMYAAGARGYFDALSIHPYSDGRAPDDCSVPGKSFACGIDAVRAVMLANQDSSPMWLTEFGVQSAPPIGETAQADYLREATVDLASRPFVTTAMWYQLFDPPGTYDLGNTETWGFGLFNNNLAPRPIAWAFPGQFTLSSYLPNFDLEKNYYLYGNDPHPPFVSLSTLRFTPTSATAFTQYDPPSDTACNSRTFSWTPGELLYSACVLGTSRTAYNPAMAVAPKTWDGQTSWSVSGTSTVTRTVQSKIACRGTDNWTGEIWGWDWVTSSERAIRVQLTHQTTWTAGGCGTGPQDPEVLIYWLVTDMSVSGGGTADAPKRFLRGDPGTVLEDEWFDTWRVK